jgi:hypothetical protein
MKIWIYKIIKYLIAGTVLFLLLKYAPDKEIKIIDIAAVLAIAIGILMVVDFMCISPEQNCACENKEPFTSSCESDITANKTKIKNNDNTDNADNQDDNQDDEDDEDDDEEDYGNDNDVNEEETDVPYSQLEPDQYVKLGDFGNPNRRSFRDPKYKGEYGDWYIPPEEWYPPCVKQNKCATNNGCTVQPVYTDGTNVDLREFDNSRKISPPIDINIDYARKINGGKAPKIRGKRNVPNNAKIRQSCGE